MQSSPVISSILGNAQKLDGGSMFGNAPREVWKKWCPPDEKGRIDLATRAFLVEWENKKILLETGIGAFFEPKLAERFGVQTPTTHQLLKSLEKRGIEEGDIDVVILSHLHFDHAGGLLPVYGSPLAPHTLHFPHAQYWVGQEHWRRAQNPHPRDKASFVPGMTSSLEQSGRLVIIHSKPPAPFDSLFEFVVTQGHTPGQMHTLVKGPKACAFFAGDLIPGEAWVHLPITMGYDRFAEQVIDEKKAVYQRAQAENWWFLYTHDRQTAASQIEEKDNRFIPLGGLDELNRFPL